jgi:CheY-like chemotaxis protein
VTGTSESRPLVLVAGLDPIFQVGIVRVLADGGAEVFEETDSNPDALVRWTAERGPNAIVLGDGLGGAPGLSTRLRAAAPAATLMLWRTNARVVSVLAPGVDAPRVIPAPTASELSGELFGRADQGETCPGK